MIIMNRFGREAGTGNTQVHPREAARGNTKVHPREADTGNTKYQSSKTDRWNTKVQPREAHGKQEVRPRQTARGSKTYTQGRPAGVSTEPNIVRHILKLCGMIWKS